MYETTNRKLNEEREYRKGATKQLNQAKEKIEDLEVEIDELRQTIGRLEQNAEAKLNQQEQRHAQETQQLVEVGPLPRHPVAPPRAEMPRATGPLACQLAFGDAVVVVGGWLPVTLAGPCPGSGR